jgi:hypothetical protein
VSNAKKALNQTGKINSNSTKNLISDLFMVSFFPIYPYPSSFFVLLISADCATMAKTSRAAYIFVTKSFAELGPSSAVGRNQLFELYITRASLGGNGEVPAYLRASFMDAGPL